jgi:tRNA nucleotidyltransferase (CCA-adding enzyme)
MTKTPLTTLLSFFAPLRAYIVGGAVRDYLRGISPKDIDVVVVGATPEHLLQLGGIPVDPKTGIPVFKFKINSLSVEVALPRREVKTQAGYKGFKFVTSPDIPLEEDLQRRDFTINAIAMDAYGNIVDPFGGIKDLHEGILRVVNPKSFVEDPLRVFRAARFAAKGFRIAQETLNLMQEIPAGEFKALPVERFSRELLKALREPYPEEFIKTIVQVPEACRTFFPELLKAREIPAGPMEHHPEGDLLSHIIQVVQGCKTLEGRFAALLHDCGKLLTPPHQWPKHYGHDVAGELLAKEICQKLRVPAYLRDIAAFVAKNHMKAARPDMRPAKLIQLADAALKARAHIALVEVCRADGAPDDAVQRLEKALDVVSIPARELGVSLQGTGAQIRDRILQKRVTLMYL